MWRAHLESYASVPLNGDKMKVAAGMLDAQPVQTVEYYAERRNHAQTKGKSTIPLKLNYTKFQGRVEYALLIEFFTEPVSIRILYSVRYVTHDMKLEDEERKLCQRHKTRAKKTN